MLDEVREQGLDHHFDMYRPFKTTLNNTFKAYGRVSCRLQPYASVAGDGPPVTQTNRQ